MSPETVIIHHVVSVRPKRCDIDRTIVFVDDKTCKTGDGGSATLCAVWRDPDFDAGAPAYYYVRVLENPTCRWSTYECNKYAPGQAPPGCADKNIARTIQERAVTSAIWYLP